MRKRPLYKGLRPGSLLDSASVQLLMRVPRDRTLIIFSLLNSAHVWDINTFMVPGAICDIVNVLLAQCDQTTASIYSMLPPTVYVYIFTTKRLNVPWSRLTNQEIVGTIL